MDNANGAAIAVFSALTTAIAWLAKRLYEAPRQSEVDRMDAERTRILDDCDKLKLIVDRAAEEARRSLAEREAENRKLEAKIAKLESAVLRAGRLPE